MDRRDNARTIRSPRGTTLSARSWQTEAPLRMLMNNLDPDVAERPRSWSSMAASAAPRATGTASTASSARCAGSSRTRRCWSSRASRSASSAPMPTRRAC